jgi:hypothetical protein
MLANNPPTLMTAVAIAVGA